MFGFIVIVLLAIIVLSVLLKCFVIVQQETAIVVEEFGKFKRVLEPGLNWITPFIEQPKRIAWKTVQKDLSGRSYSTVVYKTIIDKRESVYDFPRQNVITKDNVTIGINALIYFQVVDPRSVAYSIQNLTEAIEKLTQTTLRNIIGEMDLDETFVSRDTINDKLRIKLDEASDKWGVKVNRIELQDIVPPADIQASMEKQMKAERERRAVILEAEGMKKSAILKAEGEKLSQINQAEGEKQAAILKAEGQAQARIKQAEAEAAAIQKTIDAISGHGEPDKYLIAVRYLDTLKSIASGQDNKVVYMPYEATGVLSSIDGIKEMLTKNK